MIEGREKHLRDNIYEMILKRVRERARERERERERERRLECTNLHWESGCVKKSERIVIVWDKLLTKEIQCVCK